MQLSFILWKPWNCYNYCWHLFCSCCFCCCCFNFYFVLFFVGAVAVVGEFRISAFVARHLFVTVDGLAHTVGNNRCNNSNNDNGGRQQWPHGRDAANAALSVFKKQPNLKPYRKPLSHRYRYRYRYISSDQTTSGKTKFVRQTTTSKRFHRYEAYLHTTLYLQICKYVTCTAEYKIIALTRDYCGRK